MFEVLADHLRVDKHCFREDNCIAHPEHVGSNCCCCGFASDLHIGCDCD